VKENLPVPKRQSSIADYRHLLRDTGLIVNAELLQRRKIVRKFKIF
jgi:hypothetical protein